MSSSTFATTLVWSALITAVAAGCSAGPSSPPWPPTESAQGSSAESEDGTDESALKKRSRKCANKACGADCTPAGSDEPFNCNASGKCVAAGRALGCHASTPSCANKNCGADCSPAGSDEPFNCNASGKCVVAGQPLGCGQRVCPEFLGDCIQGQRPADLDGDGCIDGCAAP